MKTPSPQEAAKTDWAREKARGLRGDWNILYGEDCVVPAEAIERTLLETYDEADKNGYERGREEGNGGCCDCVRKYEAAQTEDEALLRECHKVIGDLSHPDKCDNADCCCGLEPLYDKLKARLTPSVGLSEGKGGPGKCVCGEPSPDRLVIHRTDGPCYLREPEKTVDAEAQKLLADSGGEKDFKSQQKGDSKS